MKSLSITAAASSVLGSIDSSPHKAGGSLDSLEREASFIPRVVRSEIPLYGHYQILDEASFVRLFLDEGLTGPQIQARYPEIDHHVVACSRKYYKERFAAQLEQVKRFHYCRSAKLRGNNRAGKNYLFCLLPEDTLRRMIERGTGLRRVAEELGTSEYYVRRNMEHYGISRIGFLPKNFQLADDSSLALLEQFSPGLLESARSYLSDPHLFFDHMYRAFVRVTELQWFIKELAERHRFLRESRKLPKDHICWSTNRWELSLSLALLDAGIQHERQKIIERYAVDFAFPDTNLVVEVDGAFHRDHAPTMARDSRKGEVVSAAGFRTLHFTTEQVRDCIDDVVAAIKSALSKASAPSE